MCLMMADLLKCIIELVALFPPSSPGRRLRPRLCLEGLLRLQRPEAAHDFDRLQLQRHDGESQCNFSRQ